MRKVLRSVIRRTSVTRDRPGEGGSQRKSKDL